MMHATKSRKVSRGFTLIELLVVIAIIAILAAILFPVFAKAREKARQSSCASNEKQIGIALLQYVQDYDETWPNYYVGNFNGATYNGTTGWAHWQYQVYSYVKSTGVFTCPSNNVKTGLVTADCTAATYGCSTTISMDYDGNSYTNNNSCIGGSGGTTTFDGVFGDAYSSGVINAKILTPTSTIAVYETDSKSNWPQPGCNYNMGNWFAGHTTRGNFLFVDGHVKALRFSDTNNAAGPTNMWSRDNFGYDNGSSITAQVQNSMNNYPG